MTLILLAILALILLGGGFVLNVHFLWFFLIGLVIVAVVTRR